jgi:hypothetical protein
VGLRAEIHWNHRKIGPPTTQHTDRVLPASRVSARVCRVAGHGLAGNRLPLLSPSGLQLTDPPDPSFSLSLSFSLCGSLGQKNIEEEMKKKEEREKKNMKWVCNRGCVAGEEEEKRRKKEKKRKNERDPLMQRIREKKEGKITEMPLILNLSTFYPLTLNPLFFNYINIIT